MARLPRLCPVGIPQHVIQRGNNRQICFTTDGDVAAYVNGLYQCPKKSIKVAGEEYRYSGLTTHFASRTGLDTPLAYTPL